MSLTYLYILGASLLTSLLSFSGALSLVVARKKINRLIIFLVSLSAGTLLGDSFIHILPEATSTAKNSEVVWLMVIAGILLFFVLEKIIHWRHCHVSPDHSHPHPVGAMNLVGDGLHNLLDGVIIATSFLIDIRLGLVTTLAVIAHEIPQELGDFGTLLHAGFSVKRALLFNFLSGLTSFLGALLVILFGQSESFLAFMLPLTAGGFIYIASSDLIPELKKEISFKETVRQLIGIFLGLGLMLALKIFAI